DGPSFPDPSRHGVVQRFAPSVTGETCQQPSGKAAACLEVAAAVGRAGGLATADQEGEQAGDGLAAGMVGVKHLGEEDQEGQPRRVEAVTEAMPLFLGRLPDLLSGEQVGEGQAGSLGELTELGLDL